MPSDDAMWPSQGADFCIQWHFAGSTQKLCNCRMDRTLSAVLQWVSKSWEKIPASLMHPSTHGRSSNDSSMVPRAQLGESRKPTGSLASPNLPKGVTMTQSQEDSSSSLNMWNCTETSSRVRHLNWRWQWKML